MVKLLTIILLASPLLVFGQQIGKHTPEVHPKLSWEQCKAGGHCTKVDGGIVIDAEWRWVHDQHDKACFGDGNKMDPTVCPDEATCSKNCAFEGADYKVYGVSTSGNSLHQTLKPGSRLYMTANDSSYQMFHLLDQEFTFDVDTSKVPCGGNGALYLVSMEHDGGMHRNANNKAGAKYGMGYCDAQCAKNMKFTQSGHGACCAEMDIWEANNAATTLTPHPCTTSPWHLCTGDACNGGTCEQGGCGYNPYQTGAHSFYGPGKTVDTNKVFTVVTQFITSGGHLSEIRRFYVQGGKVIPSGGSISEKFCEPQKSFNSKGGLKQMGNAIKAGMVLAFALWDDAGGHMTWLDSGSNGPCPANGGSPAEVEAHNPYIVWSNIRVGPINSTFHH